MESRTEYVVLPESPVRVGRAEANMNAIQMVVRCRKQQRLLGDDEPMGPLSLGPFVDDHGEMINYVTPSVPEPIVTEDGP